MTEVRFPPRRIDLEALVGLLVKEHAVMRDGLQRAKEAAARRDFTELSKELKRLDPVFRQHIADEESQVLRLLIDHLGVEGASDEIRVFQQHRPIYQLMKRVTELAAKPAAELEEDQAKLDALFEGHTLAEEQRVFPRAMLVKEQGHPHGPDASPAS